MLFLGEIGVKLDVAPGRGSNPLTTDVDFGVEESPFTTEPLVTPLVALVLMEIVNGEALEPSLLFDGGRDFEMPERSESVPFIPGVIVPSSSFWSSETSEADFSKLGRVVVEDSSSKSLVSDEMGCFDDGLWGATTAKGGFSKSIVGMNDERIKGKYVEYCENVGRYQ